MSKTALTELTDYTQAFRTVVAQQTSFTAYAASIDEVWSAALDSDLYLTETAENLCDGSGPLFALNLDEQSNPDTDINLIYDPDTTGFLWQSSDSNWYDQDGSVIYVAGLIPCESDESVDQVQWF